MTCTALSAACSGCLSVVFEYLMSTLGSCLRLYEMNIAGEVSGPGYNKLVK